ncbi:hypothetical protein MLD38_004272 [Melastoma candidum]|uniref:Uncharacterized protein n=1 Tax=Melastoma candidum TaxID=119954 RepID=A0ACB9S8E5_9MYRT|nr:hypothetical protein MLD38_004272 [Melastoma candidum]
MEGSEIETSAESLGSSIVYHVVNDILGFVLFMYQQIPSILPDMSLEFATILGNCKELEAELAKPDLKAASRRSNLAQLRELKQVVRRREKFMNMVSRLQSAIGLVIKVCPDIPEVMLVLGGSVLRPLCAYSLCFLHGNVVSRGESDLSRSKAVDVLSRKAIRALISQSAGSSSCPGSMKLFLLVKAPSSFNQHLDYLPKRDFKISKKVAPFRLLFRCRKHIQDNGTMTDSQTSSFNCLSRDLSKDNEDLIWFQCRHVIKGLACRSPTSEE